MLVLLLSLSMSACKLTDNAINSDSNESRDLDNIPPQVAFSVTPQINISNQLNYMLSGTCSEDDVAVLVKVGSLNLYTTCVSGIWAVSGDVSVAADSPTLLISVTQEDAANNVATHSTHILKDTVAPTISIAASTTALSDTGGSPDILATFSEAVSRNDTDVSNHGERLFLTSSIDNSSVSVDALTTTSTKMFSSFYISSALNTVTLVNNYSAMDPQTIFFQDAAGNVMTTSSNTLTFTEVCGGGAVFAAMAGGNGTLATPYEITDITQLNEIRNADNCKYRLMNNIDASATSTWNGGQGWEPLSLNANGRLDGQNYKVTSLHINYSGGYGGIFGYIAGTLKDIEFDGVSMMATGNSSGMVGYIASTAVVDNVRLSNSTFETTHSGGDAFGGLYGYSEGTLTNLHITNVTVRADQGATNINGILCCIMGSSVNGITVTNLQVIGSASSRVEFFGYYQQRNLSNVTITNSSVYGGNVTGFFPPFESTVSNLTISNFTVTGTNSAVGLAHTLTANLNNVNITNMTVSGGNSAVGLIQSVENNGSISNMTVNGLTVTSSSGVSYGGFYAIYGSLNNINIKNAALSGQSHVYGVASYMNNNGSSHLASVSDLLFSATINGLGSAQTRGLFGTVDGSTSIGTVIAKIETSNTAGSNDVCAVETMNNTSFMENVALECTGNFTAVAVKTMNNSSGLNQLYVRGPKGAVGSLTGLFISSAGGSTTVSDTFYNSDYGITPYSTIGRTTAQLKNIVTYAAWDFSEWSITSDYPFLNQFPGE